MPTPGDARLERILANVLWTGVMASSFSLAVGLVLTLVLGGSSSGPWLTIGLLTLMATPVARVAVSAAAYMIAALCLTMAPPGRTTRPPPGSRPRAMMAVSISASL